MGKNKVYMVSDRSSTYVHGLTLKEAVRTAREYRDSDESYDGRIIVAKAVPGSEEEVDVDLDDPVFMTKTELRERLGKAEASSEEKTKSLRDLRRTAAQEKARAANRMIEAGYVPMEVLTRFLVDIRVENTAYPETFPLTCDYGVLSMGMMETKVELHLKPYPMETGAEPDPFVLMMKKLKERSHVFNERIG